MRKITSIRVWQQQNGLVFAIRHENGKTDKKFSRDMTRLEQDAMRRLLNTMVVDVDLSDDEIGVYYYPK